MKGQLENARGLDRFAVRLSSAVLKDIEPWQRHPELGKLIARLGSLADPQAFLDALAEVVIARRLLQLDCAIRVEVPTKNRRSADFEATHGGQAFYVHVKRLNTDAVTQKQSNLSNRTKALEKIARNVVVIIQLCRDLTDVEMQELVAETARFVRKSEVGAKFTFMNGKGTSLARCEIKCELTRKHVGVIVNISPRRAAGHVRLRKLLRKAYDQFMPNAHNVIAVTSNWLDDEMDFDRALLGTAYETWNGLPPSAELIEHGYEDDGFWSNKKHYESQVAAFFHFDVSSDDFQSRIWVRSGTQIEPPLVELLHRIFDTGSDDTARGG